MSVANAAIWEEAIGADVASVVDAIGVDAVGGGDGHTCTKIDVELVVTLKTDLVDGVVVETVDKVQVGNADSSVGNEAVVTRDALIGVGGVAEAVGDVLEGTKSGDGVEVIVWVTRGTNTANHNCGLTIGGHR